MIHTEGQLNNAAEFAQQIIAYRNGAPVRFADVANVIDGVENPRNYGAWGDKNGIVPAVTVAINRQPGANTVAVVDAVKAALPQLLSELPPSIKVAVTLDKSSSIRRSVNEVQATLLISAFLVIAVLSQSARGHGTLLLVVAAIPIAIVGSRGRKTAEMSTPRADATRPVGPPQGTMLIVEFAEPSSTGMISGFMPSRR